MKRKSDWRCSLSGCVLTVLCMTLEMKNLKKFYRWPPFSLQHTSGLTSYSENRSMILSTTLCATFKMIYKV